MVANSLIAFSLIFNLVVIIYFLKTKRELNQSLNKFFDFVQSSINNLQDRVRSNQTKSDDLHDSLQMLVSSIIVHLHASGTVYSTRIFDTQIAYLSAAWEEENRKYPDYLPILNNPFNLADRINFDDYKRWQRNTMSDFYRSHPNLRVTETTDDEFRF